MSPEQLAEFNQMKAELKALREVRDVAFIAELERRLNFLSGDVSLNDLSDVVITSVSSGQVLKYNGTNWAPGTDNIA